MNCDLWRSHGRIFAHLSLLFDCVCGICLLKSILFDDDANCISMLGLLLKMIMFLFRRVQEWSDSGY